MFEKLVSEKARQVLGDQWWDDPLVREKFDSAFEMLIAAGEQERLSILMSRQSRPIRLEK